MPEVPRVTQEFRDDTGSIILFHPGNKVPAENSSTANNTSVENYTWRNQMPVNINTTATISKPPEMTSIIPYLSPPENTTTTTSMETTKTILLTEIPHSTYLAPILSFPLPAYPTTTFRKAYKPFRPYQHSNTTRSFNLTIP